MAWKALILAGGSGSRLYPLTASVNKHLLPVFDKPMVYYPIATLMLGGFRDFVIVCNPEDIPSFQRLLGDGSQWGVSFAFRGQDKPRGIADGFLVAEDLLAGHDVALGLGDNIFYGAGLPARIQHAASFSSGATVFAYEVADPRAFGVVELGPDGRVISLIEKPAQPKTNLAVPGLYLYDQRIIGLARDLKPSRRGELEITDINLAYLAMGELRVEQLGRGIAWLEGGTPETLFNASQFIKVVEERSGLKIGCLEEVAWHCGYIDRAQFARLVAALKPGAYADYLRKLLDRGLQD